METTITQFEAFKLSAPKGLSFSQELLDECVKYLNLSKEEKKTQVNLKKELISKVKSEFKTLKTDLKAKINEEVNKLKEEHALNLKNIEEEGVQSLKVIEDKYASITNKTQEDETEYKNAIKGAKFVIKRSKIKENANFDLLVKDEKILVEDLYNDYLFVLRSLKTTGVVVLESIQKTFDVFVSTFSFQKFITNKSMWVNLIPFFMLVILIAAFFIAKSVTGYGGNLTDVINNGVFIAVVATGAVFIYSSGSFDMSLGPASLMCATLAGIVWNSTHNIYLSFLIAISVGALLGIINAILANILNLPVMVMTLTMMNILNAVHAVILKTQNNQLFIDGGMVSDGTTGGIPTATIVYATFLVCFFLLLWAIFNYTKIGRRNKFIGSNPTAAKYNGISLMKAGVISFAISGIGLGLCGFLFAMSKSGSSYSTGTILDTIGLNVVIAIVFGGMTTSGGPRSRVSCAVIGAFFCIFLDELFRACNIADYRYLAKGIIFLVVSFANMYNSRPKMLAR